MRVYSSHKRYMNLTSSHPYFRIENPSQHPFFSDSLSRKLTAHFTFNHCCGFEHNLAPELMQKILREQELNPVRVWGRQKEPWVTGDVSPKVILMKAWAGPTYLCFLTQHLICPWPRLCHCHLPHHQVTHQRVWFDPNPQNCDQKNPLLPSHISFLGYLVETKSWWTVVRSFLSPWIWSSSSFFHDLHIL